MIRVRPSLPGDTWLILPDVREAEIIELHALGISPEVCLRYGILYFNAQTLFIDEEPAGVFGIADFDTHRVPWAVFTSAIDRHPLPFLRFCRRWAESARGAPVLMNVVDVRNERAIEWFKFMGFEIDEPIPYGLDGELFRPVRMH